jgi:hypothetical protein
VIVRKRDAPRKPNLDSVFFGCDPALQAGVSTAEFAVEALDSTLTLEKAALPPSGKLLKLTLRRKDGIEPVRQPPPPPGAAASDGPVGGGSKSKAPRIENAAAGYVGLANQARACRSLLQLWRSTCRQHWSVGTIRCGNGLRWQGATCYMNSVLQSLYMTPEFRHAIFSWNSEEIVEANKARSPYIKANALYKST